MIINAEADSRVDISVQRYSLSRMQLTIQFKILMKEYLYTVGFSRQSATRCQGTRYAASLLDTTCKQLRTCVFKISTHTLLLVLRCLPMDQQMQNTKCRKIISLNTFSKYVPLLLGVPALWLVAAVRRDPRSYCSTQRLGSDTIAAPVAILRRGA